MIAEPEAEMAREKLQRNIRDLLVRTSGSQKDEKHRMLRTSGTGVDSLAPRLGMEAQRQGAVLGEWQVSAGQGPTSNHLLW